MLLDATRHTHRTCHIHRAVLIAHAPDAQLSVVVVAPALDTATIHYDARVVPIGCNGDGGDTCGTAIGKGSGGEGLRSGHVGRSNLKWGSKGGEGAGGD